MLRDAARVLAACEELDDLIQTLRSDRLNEDAARRLRTWLDRTRPAAVAAHRHLTDALRASQGAALSGDTLRDVPIIN